MTNTKTQNPVKQNLWVHLGDDADAPRLTGCKCTNCNELFFPKKENGICTYCQGKCLEDILLSKVGKIYSFTIVMQRPPTFYQGEVPYAIGFVELPEGIRVETLFTGCDFEQLVVGMSVQMVVERLHLDENENEILTYKFRPICT